MTLRERDVPTMMARVHAALEAADTSAEGAVGVISLQTEGDADVNVARVRHLADIDLNSQSGSDRPGLGRAIRLAKRVVRRSLRWYLEPMMRQQSEFNHASLDLMERLRLRVVTPAGGIALRGRGSGNSASYERWQRQFSGRTRVLDLGAQATSATQQLRQLPAASVEAVFVPLALITYAADLVPLLDGIATVLNPGGVVVVEMSTGGDARSQRRVHPDVVSVALQACGFVDVRHESRDPAALSESFDGDRATLAKELTRLDRVLSSSASRALVATRSPAPS